MTRSRAVANAAGMLFAAQLLLMVVQFGYSAITGRLVSATGFGAYTVAMGLSSLVSLMLSAGLPAFALKEKDLDHGGEASLWTMAWLSGIASGIVVFLTAGLWSTLWAQPEATLITRAFAINAVFAPVVAVQLALGRRRGYVRGDAAVLVISGILGYIVGAVAVYLTGSAVSLVIAPTATSLIAVIVALPMVRPWPRAWPKGWKTAGRFAGISSGLALSTLLMGNVQVWAVSVGTTSETLGQFSRAMFLGLALSGLIQTSVMRAAYPHFRHVRGDGWQSAVLTMTRTAAVVSLLPAALLSGVAMPLMLTWLGPTWGEAGAFAPALIMGSALMCVVGLLMGMGESQAWMAGLTRLHVVRWVSTLIVALPTLFTHNAWWVVASMIVSPVITLAYLISRELEVTSATRRQMAEASLWAGGLALVIGGAAAMVVVASAHLGLRTVGQLGVGLVVGTLVGVLMMKLSPGLRAVVAVVVGGRFSKLMARIA